MRRRSNTTVLPSAGSASKSSYPRRRCQPDKMTAIEALHRGYDRRLTGPPLRRSSVCIGICAALVVLLTFATFVHLSLSPEYPAAVVAGKHAAHRSGGARG